MQILVQERKQVNPKMNTMTLNILGLKKLGKNAENAHKLFNWISLSHYIKSQNFSRKIGHKNSHNMVMHNNRTAYL